MQLPGSVVEGGGMSARRHRRCLLTISPLRGILGMLEPYGVGSVKPCLLRQTQTVHKRD
jgi:hypothetical protein